MELAIAGIGRQCGRQARAEHGLAIGREHARRLDADARLHGDARRRLPAILEVGAVVMLVGVVADAGAAVEAAQHVALEEDVGAAGRPRRPEVVLDRRERAARLVLDVRIEIGAAAELVRSELVVDEERHRG